MYYKDKAIVLSRKTFREDDLLVTIYTQKYGKIILQAVGAKKIKSKMAGHVEPMNLVEIEWVNGKTLDKLTGAVISSSFSAIKKDLDKTSYALYFLGVIDKITQIQHPDQKIFEFLKNVLERLTTAQDKNLLIIKLCFDYKLLFLLGYNPIERKELNNKDRGVIEKIIKSPVDMVIGLKIDKNILNKLQIKSKIFLEEVVEKEIGI